MVHSWGLQTARKVLRDWADAHVAQATREKGLGVQFEGIEGWLLTQSPQTLEEAEYVLEVLTAFQAGNTQSINVVLRRAGEHRRDGEATSRVSHSFAPRAYGPLGGRA